MPTFAATFGVEKGIYSGTTGKTGALKFHQIRGIGTDDAGNIYIGNTQWHTLGPGLILESYSLSSSILNWRKYCVMFVDALGIDAATNGKDVYGAVEHFTVDYTKPVGEEASYVGYNVNRYKYPHDPRLNIKSGGSALASVAVRNISGKKFLAMSRMKGGLDAVFRFNSAVDGEVAIPCIYFGKGISPQFPGSISDSWMWRDLNANGQMEVAEYIATRALEQPDGGYGTQMDENGTIWSTAGDGIHQLKCLGIDANSIPIYDGQFTIIPKPQPFTSVRRAQYDIANDRMYLGGTTNNYPSIQHWKVMGRAIHRYDNWSKGNRNAQSELVVPYDVSSNTETISFDVEQDYIFTIVDEERSENFKRGQINVFNVSNYTSVGHIRAPWEGIGYPDIVKCLDVFKRKNGEYIIIMEDDGRSKNIMYRWCPTGNCLDIPTSKEDLKIIHSLAIYPNPAKSELFISGNIAENASYEITSIEGKGLRVGLVSGRSITIDNLKAGLYIIKIKPTQAKVYKGL